MECDVALCACGCVYSICVTIKCEGATGMLHHKCELELHNILKTYCHHNIMVHNHIAINHRTKLNAKNIFGNQMDPYYHGVAQWIWKNIAEMLKH